MTRTPDPALERIAEIARTGSGRSPLYRWMRQRHDRLIELLGEARPDWRKLTAGFAEIGLTGPNGLPLTPESVRHTWWRVRRDRKTKPVRVAPAVMAIRAPAPPDHSGELPEMLELRRQLNLRSGRSTDAP